MGPEPFDLTLEEFRDQLRSYRGEIKGVLTLGEETQWLYEAIQSVLRQAIATLRERVGREIHREVRDFLVVHGKGGEPCPVCGSTVAEIKSGGRATNFCRTCQPGGLIRF